MAECRVHDSLVIGTRGLGESDLLVTLLTRDSGKRTCVAKGAKKSRKRFMNALEPFTRIDAVVRTSERSSLDLLENATMIESHEAIRNSYEGFVMASLCVELVDMWCREGQREVEIHRLLLWYLTSLCKGEDSLIATLIFKTRLLDACGHMPRMDLCSRCGNVVNGSRISYEPATGLPMCQGCHQGSGHYVLSMAAAKSLRFWQAQPMDRLLRLKVGRVVAKEVWAYLRNIHSTILEKEPKAYRLAQPLCEKA